MKFFTVILAAILASAHAQNYSATTESYDTTAVTNTEAVTPQATQDNLCAPMKSEVRCMYWVWCEWNEETQFCRNKLLPAPTQAPATEIASTTTTTQALPTAQYAVASESTATQSTGVSDSNWNDPNFCVTQHSMVGCGLYNWCEWNHQARRCHAKADDPVSTVNTAHSNFVASESNPTVVANAPVPTKTSDLCEQMRSEVRCMYWTWCEWEESAQFCRNKLKDGSAKTATPVSNSVQSLVQSSESTTATAPATDSVSTESLTGCGTKSTQSGCRLLPWCLWSGNTCHEIIMMASITEAEPTAAETTTETESTSYGVESQRVGCSAITVADNCKLANYCVWYNERCNTVVA